MSDTPDSTSVDRILDGTASLADLLGEVKLKLREGQRAAEVAEPESTRALVAVACDRGLAVLRLLELKLADVVSAETERCARLCDSYAADVRQTGKDALELSPAQHRGEARAEFGLLEIQASTAEACGVLIRGKRQ